LKTEIGEQIVGAYLKYIKNCEIITYNVRSPGGGLEGLNEFDVIGFNFEERKVFIAEVTTHICGTLYYNYENTIKKIKDKHRRQIIYAEKYLKELTTYAEYKNPTAFNLLFDIYLAKKILQIC